MSPRELGHHRLQDVQKVLPLYKKRLPDTDSETLARLCRAVLASIDVRDLRELPSETFVAQVESFLPLLRRRKGDAIEVTVAAGDPDIVVIQSAMADQPFLVSALRALMHSEGLDIKASLNAIVPVDRDAQGLPRGFEQGPVESLIRLEARLDGEAIPPGLEDRVRRRLLLAQRMVRDFPTMKIKMAELADLNEKAASALGASKAQDLREQQGLLRWLCEENYVLFSYETFDIEGRRIEALGTSSLTDSSRDKNLLAKVCRSEERLVRFVRGVDESPVHRAGKPGVFYFARYDQAGKCIGTAAVEGLFTYKALHTPPEEIPSLRVFLREMMKAREVSQESYRGKSMTNAFNSLPLEYLLAESRENVWELTDRVLRAEAEGGSDVHIKIGEDRRFAFVFVSLPRWQFSEELRLSMQKILLQKFGASYCDYGLYIDRDQNAIMHFYISGIRPLPAVDVEGLREEVLAQAKGWSERLREALGQLTSDSEEVAALFSDYVEAFSEDYVRRAGGERLAADLECLQRLRHGTPTDCDLFVSRTGDHPGSINLRVFTRDPVSLSKQMPVITAFGFEVIDEYTREVRLPHMPPVGMHTFRLNVRQEQHGAVLARRSALREALVEVFAGQLGDDTLNRLVVGVDLDPNEVQILRAYVDYLYQLPTPFSTQAIREVMATHPSVARTMVDYLAARFDPDVANSESAERFDRQLTAELKLVADYTSDRVLRAMAALVRATERTNAFVADRLAGEAFAFKLDGRKVPFGPEPRPFREIWVHHTEFQGVHMRGGKVARGGLRFSDRPEDFRTEVHDLMSTQMVKNVLIVPVGAKGGFVIKNPPTDRAELRRAGDATYARFVRALLSITDNVVNGEIVVPEHILYTEESDPYLVVAADKGTAHLSDTANRQSQERGFWMDDAFASGGSNGYDHKATGITARGAWETTIRNFREIGLHPEHDIITAIGVGDMSGDVFGNGLLRSRTIKLLGAFNHVHVFIDPSPDPELSFIERKRLFELPGSQWTDYNPKVLSPGGGVYDRRAKEVPLSPEARALLGVSEDATLSGEEVIRAILRIHVDLVWMGGIGTYVKASAESHSDVGDKNNDAVRVDARELRCRVFSEGANLAITERGRVELSKRGTLNYTSFLDNSGGVDLSDHEVNIKILFAPLLASGQVTREARNVALREVENEVCEMVLENNRSQSRMVSYDVHRSKRDIWRYSRTQTYLQAMVGMIPEAFALPTSDEMAARAAKGEGLIKCEGSALGSHAKMLAYRELLEDAPLPEALVDRMVSDYFPQRIREIAGEEALQKHLLRREIATTMVVNRIVDNAGASFFAELGYVTGRKSRDLAIAYFQAADLAGIEDVRADLFANETKENQHVVYEALSVIEDALESAVFYLLGPTAPTLDAERLEIGSRLLAKFEELLPKGAVRRLGERAQSFVERGISPFVAHRLTSLGYLTSVFDTLALCANDSRSPEEIFRLRLSVAERMRTNDVVETVARKSFISPYDGLAIQALTRQLEVHVHKLTRMVGGNDVDGMLKQYGLLGLRDQIAAYLESEVGIAGLVMIDLQFRRLLPQNQLHST
jgi:glutamate dehydrogenase